MPNDDHPSQQENSRLPYLSIPHAPLESTLVNEGHLSKKAVCSYFVTRMYLR